MHVPSSLSALKANKRQTRIPIPPGQDELLDHRIELSGRCGILWRGGSWDKHMALQGFLCRLATTHALLLGLLCDGSDRVYS